MNVKMKIQSLRALFFCFLASMSLCSSAAESAVTESRLSPIIEQVRKISAGKVIGGMVAMSAFVLLRQYRQDHIKTNTLLLEKCVESWRNRLGVQDLQHIFIGRDNNLYTKRFNESGERGNDTQLEVTPATVQIIIQEIVSFIVPRSRPLEIIKKVVRPITWIFGLSSGYGSKSNIATFDSPALHVLHNQLTRYITAHDQHNNSDVQE